MNEEQFALAENLNDVRCRLKKYTQDLDVKIQATLKQKQCLLDTYDKLRNDIEEHFNDLIENELNKKRCLLGEKLRDSYDQVENDISKALNQANEIRLKIESELNNLNSDLFSNTNISNTTNKTNLNNNLHDSDKDLDYDEEDALMINDINEEFDTNNNDITSRTSLLESLMSESLLIENLDKNTKQFLNNKLIKCKIDFIDSCCGHVQSANKLDHTHFTIENSINDSNVFVRNESSSIKLSCPAEYDRDFNIHEFLDIELFDQKGNLVLYDLRERFSQSKRYIKLAFTPESYGLHKLCVKYDGSFIRNCPFYFNVLKESNRVAQNDAAAIKNEPNDVTVVQPQISRSNEILNVNQNSNMNIISNGRGRIVKQILNQHTNRGLAGGLNGISVHSLPNRIALANQNQKRKSPPSGDVYETIDQEMFDISTKLKRVNVDESNNQYYQYATPNDNEISVRLHSTNNNRMNNSIYSIDTHLRKYSNVKFGDLPTIKAKFELKYSFNLSFPIGVTVYIPNKWVFIADSGNHCVKVFDMFSGECIRILGSGPENGSLHFKRPSALNINTNEGELFVKDDKEIQVFDLKNDMKLIRKFGGNVLKRPYGLSKDSKGNLIVVDADFRKPLIHVIDKCGNVLSSKSYQPVIKDLTTNMNYPNLSKNIEAFDRTKIRFTSCQHNCLYASDLGRSIVYKTNLDGEILFAFGKHGKSKGEFNEPSGLYVDDNENILVGDSKNDRLQVYDRQGSYKCDVEFIEEKIRRPSDIYVDNDGYLYVTCFLDHCVKKYKLIES